MESDLINFLYRYNPWWHNKFILKSFKRDLYIKDLLRNVTKSNLIQIVVGMRRTGKSTIIKSLIENLINDSKVNPQRILFYSADNLFFEEYSIDEIISTFRTNFSIERSEKIYVFIDEIQDTTKWQQQVKALYDLENIQFILTGSSAILFDSNLTYLTGRYQKIKVYPLTFKEYLEFKKISISPENNNLYQKHLSQYLIKGGLPENVLSEPQDYIQTTIQGILFKDLVTKYNIRNPGILEKILYLLSDRVASTTSESKIANVLSTSRESVSSYIEYLKEVYLIGMLKNKSNSRNKEIYNSKKYYFNDTGIITNFSSKINWGALSENAIYSHLLKNKFKDIGYYLEDKNEIDFYAEDKESTFLIESKFVDKVDQIEESKQVLYRNLKVKVITNSLEGKINGVTYIPLYKYLLN